MKIDCGNCGRSFELDDGRVESLAALKCLCGNRMPLRAQASGPGQRLGKYVLINKIATGGMGEIWYGKVSGVEGFEKEVAIKKMLPHLSADRDFINMMVKEAKLTVLLAHPNVVGVYDLSKEADEYYIAMEYVPGVTVGGILEQARRSEVMLPPEVPVHITMQVLRGLAYAHNLPSPSGERLTILHRDITPQNILVTRNAFVKITDFGIAKAVNEISTTSPGMIKGKLGYIAPEQLEGREPDQRVDLFCAGILLWEMCAARRLFKGSTEIDTFRMISECRVPSLAQFRDDISLPLQTVITRSLARDPDQRFTRAEDFNAALSQAIAPRTADEFAEATGAYFGQHPEYFTSVEAHKGGSMDADSTRSVPITGAGQMLAAENLEPVSKYLRLPPAEVVTPPAPPAPSRSALPWLVGMALALSVVVALALVVVLLRPAAPAILSSSTPAPKTEAGAPSPSPSPAPPARPAATATPPSATPPSPLRRDAPAKALTGAEIQATVQRYESEIARCLRDIDTSHAPSKVDAQITIDPTGRVTQLQFIPSIEQTSIDHCLNRALKSMRFRKHPAPDVKVTIPLRIQVL